MRYWIVILFCLSFVFPAYAEEKLSEAELMKRAVVYSSKSDAYSVFCEKDGVMAQTFITKFLETNKITSEQAEGFKVLARKNFSETMTELQEGGKACATVDVMIKRFEVMRELKNVSYLLNGVDPSTLPQDPNIPSIEQLMPSSER